MVETFIIMITTLLMTPSSLTIHLLAIFKVTETDLSILIPKYFIVGIVITLTLTPPSTNTLCNIDPLHCTSMIGSHSSSTTMAFKGEGTFGTLGVDNPFFNSLRVDDTITPNVQWWCSFSEISHPHHWIRIEISRNWKVLKSKPPPSILFLLFWGSCHLLELLYACVGMCSVFWRSFNLGHDIHHIFMNFEAPF